MARIELPFIVQDTTGAAITGASVRVLIRDTNTLTTLFVDELSSANQTNPVSTITGRIPAWVNPGSYDLVVTGSNFSYNRSFEAVRGDVALGSKTFRSYHTWHFPGALAIETGPTDLSNYILPFFVSPAAGETMTVVGYRTIIGVGTSATVKVQKNSVDLTGFTGLVANTTASGSFPTAQLVNSGDALKLVVTQVAGSPGNLAFTLFMDHTA